MSHASALPPVSPLQITNEIAAVWLSSAYVLNKKEREINSHKKLDQSEVPDYGESLRHQNENGYSILHDIYGSVLFVTTKPSNRIWICDKSHVGTDLEGLSFDGHFFLKLSQKSF